MKMKIVTVLFLIIVYCDEFISAKSRKVDKRNDDQYKTENIEKVAYQEYDEAENSHEFPLPTLTSENVNDHSQSTPSLFNTEYNVPSNNDDDQSYNQEPHYYNSNEYSNDNKEKNLNIKNGLRSIAQGSANQAHSAVENQHTAAKQAAYLVKNTLAQTALQAAATAQAALTGKEILLYELEQQILDAKNSYEAEIIQLQLAKKASKSAQHAAIQAINHVSSLAATLNSAQAVATQAEHTAQKAVSEFTSQTSMVQKAKSRLESLEEQFKAAHNDFIETKKAAIKAATSAQKAQYNADEAATFITVELENSKNKAHDENESDEVSKENSYK